MLSYPDAVRAVKDITKNGKITPFKVNAIEDEGFRESLNDLNDKKVDSLPKRSAERYLAQLICDGGAKIPKIKGAKAPAVRTFVSDEQREHFDLGQQLIKEVNEYLKKSPTAQRVLALMREIQIEVEGENGDIEIKTIPTSMEPSFYLKNSRAVIGSYEVA